MCYIILISLLYIFVCMLFIGYNIMPRRVVEYCIYISCYNSIIIIGILLLLFTYLL
jgi:heme/copper-type cytochrome/quinol oxidase subunit 1